MDPEEKSRVVSRLEEMGESQVRTLLLTGGIASSWHGAAAGWLAEKDAVEKRKSEASQADTARIALSAKNAAWIAAIAAIVAAIVAIIGAVITWLAWLWPHSPQ
jgi:membrane protein YqaA with SNARE-associated domain